MHYLLNFFKPYYLNWLLNYLLNCHYFGYFDYFVHYFLHNFLNLDDSLLHPENFKNIVDVYYIYDFLAYHSNNSLVNLQNCSVSFFQGINLLKKDLYKHPEMEFNLFGALTAVIVHVLDSYCFRNIFNYLYQAIQRNFIQHIKNSVNVRIKC